MVVLVIKTHHSNQNFILIKLVCFFAFPGTERWWTTHSFRNQMMQVINYY